MDFTLSADETAVGEAAPHVAASPDAGLGYLGLVAEGLGAAGASVPLVGSGVVWPPLFRESAGGRRVAVADEDTGDGLVEDGAGAEVLVVLGSSEATAHDDFRLRAVGGLEGDG